MKRTLIIVALIFTGIFSFNETNSSTRNIKLNEENYINDIPFNTEEIFLLNSFKLEEEDYIDDIPFDTKCIFDNYQKNNN